MGTEDKVNNKIDDALGKAKEKVGDATDDEGLEREGAHDFVDLAF